VLFRSGIYNLGSSDTVAGISGAGNIQLNSYTLTTNITSDTTFSGIISGTGGITKTGANKLILSNTNTYSGNTTMRGTKTFLGTVGVNHLYEGIGNIGSVTGARPVISVDYNSQGNSLLVATNNNITTNMIFSISNIPYNDTVSTVPTFVSYSFTLILRNSPTFFCNTVNVRIAGPSSTVTSLNPISYGGLTNVTIASGATYTVQQFNVLFLFGNATPTVFTNVLSMF
jgi:autotransporter-associated beta strand protein